MFLPPSTQLPAVHRCRHRPARVRRAVRVCGSGQQPGERPWPLGPACLEPPGSSSAPAQGACSPGVSPAACVLPFLGRTSWSERWSSCGSTAAWTTPLWWLPQGTGARQGGRRVCSCRPCALGAGKWRQLSCHQLARTIQSACRWASSTHPRSMPPSKLHSCCISFLFRCACCAGHWASSTPPC